MRATKLSEPLISKFGQLMKHPKGKTSEIHQLSNSIREYILESKEKVSLEDALEWAAMLNMLRQKLKEC